MAVTKKDGLFTECLESAEDLRNKEFYFATRTAAGKAALCGAGARIAGVISEGRDVGYATSIDTGKMLKAVAGGAIAPGDAVQSDGSGQAISGSTNMIGVARNTAAQGEMVEIDVDRV